MKKQNGSVTLAYAMALTGVAFLSIALFGCGVTAGHDKACFYSEAGQKAETDSVITMIRTAKEKASQPSAALEYRNAQNAFDTMKAKIKGFWQTVAGGADSETTAVGVK